MDYALSTFDHGVDELSTDNCAVRDNGAWCYRICVKANINGLYPIEGSEYTLGHFGFAEECLKSTSLMMRRIT